MIDITHKSFTSRTAVASAILKVGSEATIDAILNNTVPKGNVLEMAKTAGLFAVKNTSNSIPDCHPLPIEFTGVEYDISREKREVHVLITVKTVYKTGVEVEAMHGASIIALTLYDMLKPIDKNIEISTVKLVSKRGGKSDLKRDIESERTAAVIVCSDTISKGLKEDKAGLAIKEKLALHNVKVVAYDIIPDEVNKVQELAKKYANEEIDLILFTGGTGLSKRDTTPEAISPILDREIPGIAEVIRGYGMLRTPYAMLSRSVAGTLNKSLVITFPGSTNGAKESVDAIFPAVLHAFKVFKGATHDN